MRFFRRPKSISEEAAAWLVRWQEDPRPPTQREQSRWLAWLRRSPEHLQAYFDIADISDDLDRMKFSDQFGLAHEQRPAVVVPFTEQSKTATVPTQSSAPASEQRRVFAVAAAVTACAIGIGWYLHNAGRYVTHIGEQRTYTLEDGSRMQLNTQSRAKVSFSNGQRVIDLEGEALFTVAPDKQRPFYVRSANSVARAVGTQFNVYARPEETRVTVLEGIVEVSAGSALPPIHSARTAAVGQPPATLELLAGEAARTTPSQMARTDETVRTATAWRLNQLVFSDATLEEVAREFNRYNETQLILEGRVGQDDEQRLSGTFDAHNLQSLLLHLQANPHLLVEHGDQRVRIRAR
ncbi:FecR family protein [Steroidobacter sp.]|uniref:FecR family protein n=1 Tax=Steroidobacter sp. TaxID=1978227 RepID=UPI001A412CED|nr:FecR domain-containing protein [Steroidobacter sp.]MBL8269207.1 FecR domain-containing protein [Steroidobacter sp.]